MTDVTRRTAVVVLLTAFAIVAAACGSSAKNAAPPASTTTTVPTPPAPTVASTTTPTTTPGPQTDWTGPSLQADGSIPAATFNALVDTSHETWTRSPLRTSLEFLQFDDTTAFTTTVRMTTNPESRREADVTVTADMLLDDSIRAMQFEVHVVRQSDAGWSITSARWSQQCQPNRGHQDFTPALCV